MKRLKGHLNKTPNVIGWVITEVVFWPIVLVRVVIIVAVLGLWVINGPRVASLVWSSARSANSTPNKNRTPKKSRALQKLLDDFDDVRARIREQS